ncbi:hypothetical protein D3C72_970040 [compost metagenome]
MAERPVFVPSTKGSRLVVEVPVEFAWHSGMAPSQKKKNVAELHNAARARGLNNLLEVSSKSDMEIGRRLSAFHQKVLVDGRRVPLESVFQSSKEFEFGGPYTDLLFSEPRDAKRDPRLQDSGRLRRFTFGGQHFPLSPPTVFYDWLYFSAIFPERDWLLRLQKLDGFTDIEFNPSRSVNCQARSCALFVSLETRGLLDEAMSSFESFLAIQKASFL